MKKFLITTFIVGMIFPSIAIAKCYDDLDWSWRSTYSGNAQIDVNNNSKNKIILKDFKLMTSEGDLMKKITLNRTLEPYGVFNKYFYPKLNPKYLKSASLSCDYHSSVKERIRKEKERKREKIEAKKKREREEIEAKKKREREEIEAKAKREYEANVKKKEKERNKRNKITYLKDKTYEVTVNILIDTYPTKYHGEWIFEDKQIVNEAVFGVATAINTSIYDIAIAGQFWGTGYYFSNALGEKKYIQSGESYLLCKRAKSSINPYGFLSYVYFDYVTKMGTNSRKILKVLTLEEKICYPNLLNIYDYKNYIEKKKDAQKNKKIAWTVALILLFSSIVYVFISKRKNSIIDYNKKHKTKVKTYSELQALLTKEQERYYLRQDKKDRKEALLLKKNEEVKRKAEKTKRLKDEKLEKTPDLNIEAGNNLLSKIKRLKSLYEKGTLSKEEFERAKNKLLK